MKKFGIWVFAFALLLILSSVFVVPKTAYAVEESGVKYLINPDYQQNKEFYGITDAEIIRLSRPFNGIDGMMQGQSFAPTYADNKIDKIYTTNSVQISNSDALYVYVYFGEINSKNLKIILSGLNFSLTWEVSAESINAEIDETTSSSHIRYGWVQLHLPVLAAEIEGALGEVQNLQILYSGAETQGTTYSKPYFYAPYIGAAASSKVSFKTKQNYYNVKINLGDTTRLCAGDKIKFDDLKEVFTYCIIGDINYLQTADLNYKVNVEITDTLANTKKSFSILGGMDYTFDKAGSYTVAATIYSGDVWLWQSATISINVNSFVGFYINGAIADITQGKTTQYTITKGTYASGVNNLAAKSSNNKVAEVKIVDGKLHITAKKAGKTTITVTGIAVRDNGETQDYSCEYSLTVVKDNSVNWLAMGLLAIGLIICTIIVYTIMVRRRLIKNKYPKY